MTKKSLAIFLNGDLSLIPKDFSVFSKVIACDGAMDFLDPEKVSVLVGDLDSIKTIPPSVQLLKFDSEKDFTDGEIAVQMAIAEKFDTVHIFGGTGKRSDHFLGNFFLLKKLLDFGTEGIMHSKNEDIFLKNKSFSLNEKVGTTISLLPFGERVHIINTKGFKYNVSGAVFLNSNTLGVSNEAVEETQTVNLSSGTLAVFINKEV